MSKHSNGPIIGAIAVVLFIMWKFPTFAMVLSIAFSIRYAIKFLKINKKMKKNPEQEISYLTNIGNKKNELMFDIRKALAISLIILVVSASFNTKSKSKDKKETLEPTKIEEETDLTEKKDNPGPDNVEDRDNPKTEDNPYEELAKYAFGENVICEVIEGWGDDNKPKIARINITNKGEPNIQPFLINVFSYLKKTKEKGLDYESAFFILKSNKTDGKEYPYAKIEITKEAVDKFDFNSKDPVDLKSIATTYDAPEDNKISTNIKNEPVSKSNEAINNEDIKTVVNAFIKAQFEDMCDVSTETVDGNFIIHLYPKSPDLKAEIAGLMIDKTNPVLLEGWNQMSKGLLELSKSVKDQVDENVSIMLHNPVNSEMVLYVTLNDIVFSDFTKE